jgi:hypothetical protein
VLAGREIPQEVAQKTDSDNAFPMEMWKKLGDAGFLGITADEDYGGLAMGYQAHCVVMEEISRASGPSPLSRSFNIESDHVKKAALPSPTPHTPSYASTSLCLTDPRTRKPNTYQV